jgi:phosphoribosylformylglycinamidine cyclo-ligase
VKINVGAWDVPAIFSYISKYGNVEEKEMFATYNMGVGMMMIVSQEDSDAVVETLRAAGETANVIGEIMKGEGVTLC